MIKLIIVFLIGMLCGTFSGIFLTALCFASKTGEEIYADVISKLELEENNKENQNEVNKWK